MPARPIVVPPALLCLARNQEGLVSARQCRAHGVTERQIHLLVRGGRWMRAARGVYDTGESSILDLDTRDRRRRRAAVLGPLAFPGAVATGVAALVLQGVQGAPPEVTPEVTFPDGSSRASPGPVRVRRIPLRRYVTPLGIPCASVEDALVQAASTVGRVDAIALMDSARFRGAIGVAGFARAADRDGRRPGGRARRSWWRLADARAESPAETWARLGCLDAGVPPDMLQLEVDDERGVEVARVDLAWLLPDGGALLVEVDGHDAHSTPEALFRDRVRQNQLTGRRTVFQRFTGTEARNGTVVARVREILVAEGWHPQRPPAGFRFQVSG